MLIRAFQKRKCFNVIVAPVVETHEWDDNNGKGGSVEEKLSPVPANLFIHSFNSMEAQNDDPWLWVNASVCFRRSDTIGLARRLGVSSVESYDFRVVVQPADGELKEVPLLKRN